MLWLSTALALATSGCAALARDPGEPARLVRGPIATRPMEPLALTTLALRPRRLPTVARSGAELELTASYGSVFELVDSKTASVELDGEILRASAALRVGVGDRTDFEIELPVTYASSGFLDAVVREFHEALGLPSNGSDDKPAFDYDMSIEKGGDEIYHLEPSEVGLNDIPLVLTHLLCEESEKAPAVALRGAIELPTGDRDDGFGNGALDYGIGVCAQQSFGRWTATGGASWIAPGDPSEFEESGVRYEDRVDAQLGGEYRWNDRISLLGELAYTPARVEGLDIADLDDAILALDLGFAWDVAPGSTLTFAFSEDLISHSGVDFAVFVGWRVGL